MSSREKVLWKTMRRTTKKKMTTMMRWEYVDVDEEEDNDEYEYVIEDSSGKKLDFTRATVGRCKIIQSC
jgi:CMP-2-keto-3-deoxyoctulosonic acid synthetase